MSPTMIAIRTIGLIFEPLFSWLLGFVVVGVVVGIVLGEDETVVVGVSLLGTNGEVAVAPSDPGLFGSTALHFSNGAPQRNEFFRNEDSENVDRVFGISPERLLPETLKSCKPGRLSSGMRPEN